MKNFKSNLLYFFMASAVFIAGCATFEGEIPVEVLAPATEYISPANQDGVQDALVIEVSVPEIEGLILDAYRFSVSDSRGRETFVIEAGRPSDLRGRAKRVPLAVPASVVWDGRGPDGGWAPDGEYTYRVAVRGADGQEGITPGALVIVDNTPPSLILSVPYQAFSPNGDGRQDVLPFYQ